MGKMAFNKKNNNIPEVDDFSDIIDEDYYGSGDGSGINIKKIIFAHLNRISENIFKVQKSNKDVTDTTAVTFVSNAERREVFIDAIDYLISILTPYFDALMRKKLKEHNERVAESEEMLLVSSIEKEAFIRAKSDKTRFDEAYNYWLAKLKKSKASFIDRASTEHEMYVDRIYSSYRMLFTDINNLLFKLDYLATQDYTE